MYGIKFGSTGFSLKPSPTNSYFSLGGVFTLKAVFQVNTIGTQQYIVTIPLDNYSYNHGIRLETDGRVTVGFGQLGGSWTPDSNLRFVSGDIVSVEYGVSSVGTAYAIINGNFYTKAVNSASGTTVGIIGSYYTGGSMFTGVLLEIEAYTNSNPEPVFKLDIQNAVGTNSISRIGTSGSNIWNFINPPATNEHWVYVNLPDYTNSLITGKKLSRTLGTQTLGTSTFNTPVDHVSTTILSVDIDLKSANANRILAFRNNSTIVASLGIRFNDTWESQINGTYVRTPVSSSVRTSTNRRVRIDMFIDNVSNQAKLSIYNWFTGSLITESSLTAIAANVQPINNIQFVLNQNTYDLYSISCAGYFDYDVKGLIDPTTEIPDKLNIQPPLVISGTGWPEDNSQWTEYAIDISTVGLGWAPSIRNYDTLRQWRDAKFESTTYEQAYCRGYLGNSFVTIASGQMTGGALIRGEIPFIGNNVHELAKLESNLTLGGGTQQNPIVAENLYVRHTGTAQTSFSVSNYNIARKSYIEHTNNTGSNGGILYLTSNGYAENCVVNSLATDNLFGIRLANSGKAKNCIAFGPSLRGGYTNWADSVFENCFFFGATGTDILLVNGATKINVATGDLTGDITGYTSDELVNFAASDYRVKAISELSSLNVGAFFDGASYYGLLQTGNIVASATAGNFLFAVDRTSNFVINSEYTWASNATTLILFGGETTGYSQAIASTTSSTTSRVQFRNQNGTITNYDGPSIPRDEPFNLKIERISQETILYINGVQFGLPNINVEILNIKKFHAAGDVISMPGNIIWYFESKVSGIPTRLYYNTTGTGTVFLDRISSLNGEISGTTSNNHWVTDGNNDVQHELADFILLTYDNVDLNSQIINTQNINTLLTDTDLETNIDVNTLPTSTQHSTNEIIEDSVSELIIDNEIKNSQLNNTFIVSDTINILILNSILSSLQLVETDYIINALNDINLHTDSENSQTTNSSLDIETIIESLIDSVVNEIQDRNSTFEIITDVNAWKYTAIINDQNNEVNIESIINNNLLIDNMYNSLQVTQTDIFDLQSNNVISDSVFLSEQNNKSSINDIVNNTADAETVFTNINSQIILSIILADSKSDILISNNIKNEQVIDTDVSDYTVTNLDIDSQINAELIQNRTSSISINSRSVIVCESELANKQNIAELINSSTTSEIYNNSLVLNSQFINSQTVLDVVSNIELINEIKSSQAITNNINLELASTLNFNNINFNSQLKDGFISDETIGSLSFNSLALVLQNINENFIINTVSMINLYNDNKILQITEANIEVSSVNEILLNSLFDLVQFVHANIDSNQYNSLTLESEVLAEQNNETTIEIISDTTFYTDTTFENVNSQNISSTLEVITNNEILIVDEFENKQVIDTDVSDYTVTNLDIDSQINAELIQNRTSSISINSRSVIVCESELANKQNIAELINSSTTSEIYNNSLVLNSQAINSNCAAEGFVSVVFINEKINNQTTNDIILFNTVATTTAEAEIINHCLVDTNIVDIINSDVLANSTVHNTQINDSIINNIAVSGAILNNVISNVQVIDSSASLTTSSQTSADTSIQNIDQNNQNISSSLLVNTRNSIVLDSIGEFEQNGESSFDLNSLSEISIYVSAINKIEEFSNISANLESNVISNNTYTNIQSIVSSIATITESTASTDIEINISQDFSSVISATTVDNLIVDTLAEQAQIINTLIDTVSNTLIVADNLYRQAGPQNILSDIVSDNIVFEDLFSEIVHVQEISGNFEILSNTVILIDNSNRNNELILQHESSSVNLISNSVLNINSLILNRQRRFTFANLETVSAVLFENEYANFDSYWDDSIPLFQEDQNITQLSIAFDNNGSPVVFYNISGTLRLFDISQNLQIFEVPGRDPVLFYNSAGSLGLPVSVVALFINSSNQIIAKTQADNFTSDTIVSQVNSTTLLSKVIENNKQQIKVFEYSKV